VVTLGPHSTVVFAVSALNDSQITGCHNISNDEKVIEGTHFGIWATPRQASMMMLATGWGRGLFMSETESFKEIFNFLLTPLNGKKGRK
jgi:hypothetical protein